MALPGWTRGRTGDSLQAYLKTMKIPSKAAPVSDWVNRVLQSWPRHLRDRWEAHLRQVPLDERIRLEQSGTRILLSGGLIVDFAEARAGSISFNGKKIATADLLHVHAGMRQLEREFGPKKGASSPFWRAFLPEAEAAFPFLALLVVGGLVGGGYLLWEESGKSYEEPPPAADVPERPVPVDSVPERPSILEEQVVGPVHVPAFCGPFPPTGSDCRIWKAVENSRLDLKSAHEVFCGAKGWTAGLSSGDPEREKKLDDLATRIEGLFFKRGKDEDRRHFRRCVRLALDREMSGCNPDSPVEALVSKTKVRLCGSEGREAREIRIRGNWVGEMQKNGLHHLCAVRPDGERACAAAPAGAAPAGDATPGRK